jgi:excisionase family DNA binding protein
VSVYLTAADVAETLGVSTRTVLRWIGAGELSAVRLPGGRLRVPQTALAAHLAAWATPPGTTKKDTGTPDARGPATRQRPGPGTGPRCRPYWDSADNGGYI